MSDTREQRQWQFYVCGQCNDKQYYTKDEEPPIPCPDCGWNHGTKKKYDVPETIKLDLTRY